MTFTEISKRAGVLFLNLNTANVVAVDQIRQNRKTDEDCAVKVENKRKCLKRR